MDGAPVHLDDLALALAGANVVADLEGLLEQQQESGEHAADGVLQRKADDYRPDAECCEQPTDVGAPDDREQHGEADDDEQRPGQVAEDRRKAVAPGAVLRRHEDGEVEAVEQNEDHEEAEDGTNDTSPGEVG